ncbi:MAG: hypothetical protein U0790_12620 [Isosphaeraceae bacterium]
MQRFRDFAMLLAVAAAVPGATLVSGQDPRAPAPENAEPKPAAIFSITVFPIAKAADPAGAQVVKEAVKAKEVVKAKAEAPPKAAALPRTTVIVQGQARPVEKPKAEAKAEPKAKAVAKRAVQRAVVLQPAMPVAALDAQVAQYLQQFRPLARAEYYFVRNVCGATGEQRKRLAEVSEQAARGAARQFVEAQQKMMQGGWRAGASYPEASKLVEDEFVKSVAFLSEEQRAKYRKERELRAASRQKVFVDNLVAKLETDLVLTPQQRDQIVASLASHWDGAWGQSLDMLQNIDHFFPNIPDQLVVPFLTEKQKTVWRRVPRNQGVFFGIGGNMMFMDPDPLDDPELVAARKAAEEKDKK